MHEWTMSFGSYSIIPRVRSRAATTQSFHVFSNLSLSHEFMEFLQELSNPSLWLGSKVTQGFIFILVAWEPPKIRAKFSCPISRI
jgi:hypothetical protein